MNNIFLNFKNYYGQNKMQMIFIILLFFSNLFLGFYSINQSYHSTDEFNSLVENNVVGMADLNKVQEALWELRFALPNYFAEPIETRKKINAETLQWIEKVDIAINHYSHLRLSMDSQSELKKFAKIFQEYLQHRKIYFEMLDQGKEEEAINYRFKYTKPSAGKAVELIQKLVEIEQLSAQRHQYDVSSWVMRTRFFMIFYLIFEVFLTIGLLNLLIEKSKLLKISEQNLIYNSKMASLGEMASGIAHEINNPMAIIVGKSSLLLSGAKADTLSKEKLLNDLERIIITSHRVVQIIKGLKLFSKTAEKIPFEKVSLKVLVDNMIDLCYEKLKANKIELIINSIPELEINCRIAEIEYVLIGLINNAKDAIDLMENKWIQFNFKIENQNIYIAITDSGKGISQEIVQKMMDPFFTTKVVGKGTGLGLSISKGIIEDHGGNLKYDSTSKNTCFIIELPITQNLQIKVS